MDDYSDWPTIKFCVDVFPAHKCPSIKFFSSIVLIVKTEITRRYECELIKHFNF